MAKRVVVVIPAYNEEQTIVEVIRGLKQRGFTRLIVVDDGSSDRTGELASHEGVIRLRHILNRGLGGALGTGISAALRIGAEVIVTFDADGQHDPNDSRRLLQPIEVGEAEVVIGSRMLDPRGIGEEEAKGLWDREVKELLAESRLRLTETIPFVFGLNCLYVVEKDSMSNNRQ
jgi:glycosyltransferase involved in cell wall biosynthesis